ncbi:MAG: ADP-ribosylation factor-like protein [Candidatus Helarchaeales archaeon]
MEERLPEKFRNVLTVSKNVKGGKMLADLSISAIKGLGRKQAKAIKNILGASSLRELAEVEIGTSELKDLIKAGIRHAQIDEWISLAKQVVEADFEIPSKKGEKVSPKNKKKAAALEKEEEKPKPSKKKVKPPQIAEPTKIIMVGLSNAGKTSIINVLKNNVNINIFGKLAPTKGVNRELFSGEESDLIIWDMGGQDLYREQYLQNPERFFQDVQLMIYVIDIQDPSSFDKTMEYLSSILDALEKLEEKPNFLVLLHKFDPDVQDDEEILENVEKMTNRVSALFEEKNLEFEIIKSSIYNCLGRNTRVIQEIRNFLSVEEEQKTEMDKSVFGPMLERVLNLMIGLSSSIEDRFAQIESQVQHLQDWIEYFRMAMPAPEQPEESAVEKQAKDIVSIRRTINEEIKEILRLRKIE